MSEQESQSQPTTMVESQQERWLKYGGNVVLVIVVVILIACLLIWCFQQQKLLARVDTTKAGLYSLKPQTVNIIKNNTQKIKIVSLYSPKRQSAVESESEDADEATTEQMQAVNDLLDEYRRKGSSIEVEAIDPTNQGTKVDQLIEEVTRRSENLDKYKAVVADYPGVYNKIEKIAATQLEQFREVLKKLKEVEDPELNQTLVLTLATVQGMPPQLKKTQGEVAKKVQQKIPDYRGATDSIEQGMAFLSSLAGRIAEDFGSGKDNAKFPAEIRAYMKDSAAAYQELKKLADDFAAKIKALGELKLDELKQSMKAKNNILVMGEKEWRVLPFRRVWQDVDTRNTLTNDDQQPKKKFAGEQQITASILSLTSKVKPKVVFLRTGGSPLTVPEIPGFQRGGPLSVIAERLRDYNFDVQEKDLSGMYAMQARMQQQFAPPEPSDEEIKDAVWIVVGLPTGRPQLGMPPTTVAPKLAAHLKNGGSALIMTVPQGESMAEALDEWGVTIHTEAVAVHEALKTTAKSADIIDEYLRAPPVFTIKEYGDHMLAKPVKSLESFLWPILPIETQPKAGYTSTKIIPIPQTLKIWGETNLEDMSSDKLKYDPPKGASKSGDMAPPLWGGAVVEKSGGGRIVVLGCIQTVFDQFLMIPDLSVPGRRVARFPGNSELFLNSVFWLSHQEPMISISPTAMEVSRIKEMNNGTLGFWRVGVLLILLPALVVVAGVVMFVKRRD